MPKILNYLQGTWTYGAGQGKPLFHAITGEEIGTTDTSGFDFSAVLDYARRTGGPALRKMTFHERGRMLKALALYLSERKQAYYEISYMTGATRIDNLIDIDGGIGNLFAYSSLRRQFPNLPYMSEGDPARLSKGGTFIGHHLLVPKEGVAIHINAFNFPVWGMLEKIAVNLLAGVPAVVKPATLTSYLTQAVTRDIISSGILPEGALQLICGNANGLLDHVTEQDVVTFTGSASTGKSLKAHPRIIDLAVPFNMEADSLNASVLGPDAVPGTPEFDIFIKEMRKEITTKCGQKCTAVRRILVPHNLVEDVTRALSTALSQTVIGNPKNEKVRMGALAGKTQFTEVLEKLTQLKSGNEVIYGDPHKVEPVDADAARGSFMAPVLLLNSNPHTNLSSHDVEAFGPVATVMPYTTIDEAVAITKLGRGSLVCSITTMNDDTARDFVVGAASHHGRILVLNRESAPESTGHGSPMPMLVHGGPGR
ncbi:MAG: phenylacetic acid degradation bifunctional protein PaaZ, partial [Flavobacteriales bacterium]|nr:phenylacetic acid degradation bifunctional protein PaaZ [Flavobacteriales bacterium]